MSDRTAEDTPTERLSSDGKKLPRCKCTVCGYEFDSASHAGRGNPRPRKFDLTICMKCGELYIFDENFNIRTPTLDELLEAGPEVQAQVERAQKLIREMRPIK